MIETLRARDKSVGAWLLVIAFLIGVMLVVGGLTRLTGSGLSITEWRPVTGAVPPLSLSDWQEEFAKYRASPQYQIINQGMSLAQFKTIYWWEWTHRFLGRFLGFVFLLPFLYFLWRRRIGKDLAWKLGAIFLLGAAQGALGWWMVRSGLAPSRVAVSQYRLSAHLGLAVLLFGTVLWAALDVLGARKSVQSLTRFRIPAIALMLLIFVQILLGAFMSGLDAGHAFADWPTYAGAMVPPGMYDLSPWWINHFENHALVHFQHRMAGYAVAIFALWLYIALRRAKADRPVRLAAAHILAITMVQIVLGIATILSGVALSLAAIHQVCALALFAASLWLVYALSARVPESPRQREGT